MNLWNSFRYTTMLHVIKKNPTTKEKQTRNLLLCKMIVWFFTKIRSYLLIVIFATLQHPFFRFTPWRPQTHNGGKSFLKSHLKLMILRIIFLIIKNRIFYFISVLRLCHSALKRRAMHRFFQHTFAHPSMKRLNLTFFKFLGKPREIGEA